MSVIVTGIDMPKSCVCCVFYVGQVGNVYCKFTRRKVGTTVACYERMKDCPLRSVDGLIEEIKNTKALRCMDNLGNVFILEEDLYKIIKECCGMEGE